MSSDLSFRVKEVSPNRRWVVLTKAGRAIGFIRRLAGREVFLCGVIGEEKESSEPVLVSGSGALDKAQNLDLWTERARVASQ